MNYGSGDTIDSYSIETKLYVQISIEFSYGQFALWSLQTTFYPLKINPVVIGTGYSPTYTYLFMGTEIHLLYFETFITSNFATLTHYFLDKPSANTMKVSEISLNQDYQSFAECPYLSGDLVQLALSLSSSSSSASTYYPFFQWVEIPIIGTPPTWLIEDLSLEIDINIHEKYLT